MLFPVKIEGTVVYLSLEVDKTDKVEMDDELGLSSLEICIAQVANAIEYFDYIGDAASCFLSVLKHIYRGD